MRPLIFFLRPIPRLALIWQFCPDQDNYLILPGQVFNFETNTKGIAEHLISARLVLIWQFFHIVRFPHPKLLPPSTKYVRWPPLPVYIFSVQCLPHCTVGQHMGKKEEFSTWSRISLKLPSILLFCPPRANNMYTNQFLVKFWPIFWYDTSF